MNLLPKTHDDFNKKDYWESFFKKRGNKAFEWYGEYPELCGNLHKYIKPKDQVLVVGCGNSSLSSDLYDVGYTKITNIDISQVVIRQMQNLHEKQRPDLKYIQMDVFDMTFDNEDFSVVLDKGTLDALMPDEKPETIKNTNKYFMEIQRVLKIGGRYVCISLLQKHILDLLLSYFPSHNWLFRVVRCFEAEKKSEDVDASLPVFMVICTKFGVLPQMILEVNVSSSDKMQRLSKLEDVTQLVSGIQQAAFVCSHLRRGSVTNLSDISFDLYKQDEVTPRYTINIVDLPTDPNNSKYAAFIVPQGREIEWMFATTKGRKYLAKISKYNRLAVITLHRGQNYENLESIQNELHDAVIQVAPAGVTGKILFLSLGSDVGSRIIRYEGDSKITGKYIVEDVKVGTSQFRRLFFLSTLSMIQSEVKLKTIKTRKGQTKDVVDHIFLTCKHHIYMSIATRMFVSKQAAPPIAVVGLGGGGLVMFLKKFMPHISITAVDVDENILQVATKWFGLTLDQKLHVKVEDGIEFLKNSLKCGKKFEIIIFDIDSKDSSIGLSCPPKRFLQPEILDNVIACLHKKGCFIINLVIRDESLRPSIVNDLKKKFLTVITYKLDEDLNEVVICSPEKLEGKEFTVKVKDASKEIGDFFKRSRAEVDEDNEIVHFSNNLRIE